jgi:shikimate kinase
LADADAELEMRAGKSIAAIFADDGEPAFRDLESQVVADLARRDHTVLAVGGGAVLRAENRLALGRNGFVVWLVASVEAILGRLAGDGATASRRPNLTTSGGEAEVRKLLTQRLPLYREMANATVDTDGKSADEVAAEVVAACRSRLDTIRPASPASGPANRQSADRPR